MEIVLIRHGQASVASADYDKLSPVGIEQSRLLGRWMTECGRKPDVVLAGGRKRQAETADAVLDAMALRCGIETDAAFDEFDHRAILLANRPDLADRAVLSALLADRSRFRAVFAAAIARWMSGGRDGYPESWDAFAARVGAGLERIGRRGAGLTWVFTSAGPISAAVGGATGLAPARIAGLTASILNGSMTRLWHHAGEWRLGSFNEVPHLDRADRALTTAL